MAYKAGTAWLQVIPSFENVERTIKAEAAKMGRQFEKEISEGGAEGAKKAGDAVAGEAAAGAKKAGKAVDEAVTRGGKSGAKNLGDEIRTESAKALGYLQQQLRASVLAAKRALPELKVTADSLKAEKTIASVRQQLGAMTDEEVGVDLDAATMLYTIQQLQRQLAELDRKSVSVEVYANARQAYRELERVSRIVHEQNEQLERFGAENGRAYGGAFAEQARADISRALRSIPSAPLPLSANQAQRDLDDLRLQLIDLGKKTIGIDIDGDALRIAMTDIQQQLERITEDRRIDISIRHNAQQSFEALERTTQLATRRAAAAAAKEAEGDGSDVGGAFGRAVTKAISDALKSLPQFPVDADTQPAEAKLFALRQDLKSLRPDRIGITVDGAEIMADLTRIRDALRALDNETVSVEVRTNAQAAIRELERLTGAAQRADAQDVDVKVTADRGSADDLGAALATLATQASNSFGRLGALIALGASLGTVIVPAAAAAAVAVAAIGVAAASGTAGIGAMVIGFSGIGGAVKNMHKAQQDAQKQAGSLARSQNSVASAVDGVRSAEAGLANTRANVAYSARRSAQQVIEAQRGVTRAERDALEARRQLTAAIADARRQQEDLALSIRGNAIAQRQAQLDLAEAKANLDKLRANPRATKAELEQAQIVFDRQMLQIDELSTAQRRMAEEKQRSDRDGIAGSEQVRRAQERVNDSTDAVARANERVAEAIEAQREQQRQGAFQIAQAQQAVVAAQRAVETASVSAGKAGSAAMDNFRESMEDLSPAGRGFSRFLYGLRAPLLQFRDDVQSALLPSFQFGLQDLFGYLPRIQGFARTVATVMGSMFTKTLRDLEHPTWQKFFAFLDESAVPNLERMQTIGSNVSRAIAGIVMALSPFNEGIGEGLVDITERFAVWSDKLAYSQGMRSFLDYVRKAGPEVLAFFREFAELVIDLVVAAAPVGLVMLRILTGIADAINSIPTGVLTVLIGVIAGVSAGLLVLVTGQKLATLAINLARVAVISTGQAKSLYNTVLARVAASTFVATRATDGLRSALTASAVAAGSAATKMNLFNRATGLIGIGLALVTWMFGDWIAKAGEKEQKTKDLTQAAQDYAAILRDGVTPETQQQAQQMLAQNVELRDLINNLRQAGIAQGQMVAALNGDAQARAAVVAVLDEQIKQEILRANEIRGANDYETKAEKVHRDRAEALKQQRDALIGASQAAEAENEATKELLRNDQLYAAHILELQSKSRGWTAQQYELAKALQLVGDNTASATDRAAAFMRAYDLMTDAANRGQLAVEGYNLALLDLKDSVDRNGTSLNDYTREGINNRNALRDLLRETAALAAEDIRAGMTIDQVNVKHRERIAEVEKEAIKLGFNRDEVRKLVAGYGTIPTDVNTKFLQQGAEVVQKAFKEILTDVEYLMKYGYLPAKPNEPTIDRNKRGQAYSEGGHVRGPGSRTSDDIPAWLSDYEYVQKAAAVEFYGVPFMDALNRMEIPKQVLPGFAGGGLVRPNRQYPGTLPMARPEKQTEMWLEGELGVNFGLIMMDVVKQRVTDAIKKKQAAEGLGMAGGPGGWQWQMEMLRAVFPGLALWSGFRPGSTTLSGKQSYHALGRAVDLAPRRDVAKWIYENYGKNTKELITPFPEYNLHNGRPHVYTGAVWRQHNFEGGNAHNHWAFSQGGLVRAYDGGGRIPPGITTVVNGTGRDEWMLTDQQMATLQAAARSGTDNRPNRTNVFHFKQANLDVNHLRAIEDREAALARAGRPR